MATQLPSLPDVKRLSPRVTRILGDNPGKFTLQGTNTYIIGTGQSRILVDTGQGFPAWGSRLSAFLESEKATISIALLTHWHHDHVNGVPDLCQTCPGVKVYKHSPNRGQLPIHDGQAFAVDGATLKALHCPGHTVDHTAFILDEEKAMFTGDNVLGHGTAVFEDLTVYMQSLNKMRDTVLAGKRGYPGHGELIEDAKAKLEEYIQHRKSRDEEVLRTLTAAGKDGLTSMGIVKIVYRDYPEALYEPARQGVLQILKRLVKDGKVTEIRKDVWTAAASSSKATL